MLKLSIPENVRLLPENKSHKKRKKSCCWEIVYVTPHCQFFFKIRIYKDQYFYSEVWSTLCVHECVLWERFSLVVNPSGRGYCECRWEAVWQRFICGFHSSRPESSFLTVTDSHVLLLQLTHKIRVNHTPYLLALESVYVCDFITFKTEV